jgi:hypothetical protein
VGVGCEVIATIPGGDMNISKERNLIFYDEIKGNWVNFEIFRCIRKLRKATISFTMSVRPHGTTRLSLDRFS